MGSFLNKRFTYDATLGKMVEIQSTPRARTHDIMCDLPDFVSPVDGKIVHGRRGLREHNKLHNTTNIADYKDSWAKWQDQRAKLFQGQGPSQVETIRRAFDDLNEGRRKRK